MRLSQRETAALIHLLHTGANNVIDGFQLVLPFFFIFSPSNSFFSQEKDLVRG